MWRKWDANEAFSFPQMHSQTLSARVLNSQGCAFLAKGVCSSVNLHGEVVFQVLTSDSRQGKSNGRTYMIIRGVIDKASWVHISSLAQTLSSMTCLLEVQQQAVGNIYNVIDNKPKKDHSSVSAPSYEQHRTNPLLTRALNRISCCYCVCALPHESAEHCGWHP